MKKLISFVLMIVFIIGLVSPSISAVKKKKRYRRIVRNWPKGGPRPVFPKENKNSDPIEVVPMPLVIPAKPAAYAPLPAKTGFFAAGGLAGGELAIEGGYGRAMGDNYTLSGGLGLTTGGMFLDLVRATFDFKDSIFLGAGLNLARLGFGLEVIGGKKFGRLSGRIGFSSVLGLRLGVGYEF